AGYVTSISEKGHHSFESTHIRKDGTIFPVNVDVTAVKDEEGKVLYHAVNIQDITERKHAEEALKEKVNELERFTKLAVGRELKMVELKKKIEALDYGGVS
ncbi:MAG: PAS domain S-box protein, partial [Thermoplasmata archaeon]